MVKNDDFSFYAISQTHLLGPNISVSTMAWSVCEHSKRL